ncbi:hypothetical protein HZA75_00305 [Candidatus Roizmanbacteria bacterium]|nr:hypothetical protein [Candidatus Roizmanbacteria bacterium]
MQTVPSILEKTPEDLFFQINKLFPYFPRFQIDIADGIFVPNRTVQIEEIIRFLKGSVKTDPYKNLLFDFHLMVSDFEKDITKLNQLKKLIKIKNIFIHFSAIRNWKLFEIRNLSSFPIGLTLNPEDQVDDLTSHYSLKQIPTIQIMSVVPGVQGNPFLPNTLKKIELLRLLGYRNKIFLDGAINEKTIPIILAKKYQPDFICPGSYLTKAKDLEKNVNYLNKL